MHKDLAPICLFVYNRLDETRQTVEALQKNHLAAASHLIIFSDGSKNNMANPSVKALRTYLKTIKGFKSITIHTSTENKGLSKSVIEGVTQVLETYPRVVVVEDDLQTSSNFLDFMNQALCFYADHPKVHSISGYTMPLKPLKKRTEDTYFGLRASSWGWATWRSVWSTIDWEVSDFPAFISDKKKRQSFNRGGSDMSQMLKRSVRGSLDSWAIRFCFHQWKTNKLTVFPTRSKVVNMGFSENASNTKFEIPEFKAILDTRDKTTFSFIKNPTLDPQITAAFAYHFSYYIRIKNKALMLLKRYFR